MTAPTPAQAAAEGVHLGAGLHTDIPAPRYHADALVASPTLSSSIAGILLSATPRHAWTAHPRLNPEWQPDDGNAAMNIGSVAHEMILDRGGGFKPLDFDDWRTKAAREARAEAIADGLTPILVKDLDRAEAIKVATLRAIKDTPACADFFDPGSRSEVVGLWQDIGGPWCRMMLDRLTPGGIIYDIKTGSRGLGTSTLQNRVEHGLALQAGFYLRGLNRLHPDLAGRFRWRWIFVEQDEPYEVRIEEPDAEALTLGDRLSALAIEKWRGCMAANQWPGYPRQIGRLGMSDWANKRIMEREETDDDASRMAASGRVIAPPTAPSEIYFGETIVELPQEATR